MTSQTRENQHVLDRDDEARRSGAARSGDRVHARRRSRRVGTRRSAHRPRRRLLRARGGRGARARGARRGRHAPRAAARGVAVQGVRRARLVDLIFRPAGGPIGDEHFARATRWRSDAQTLLVASIDDVLVTKLLALTEQEPDFQAVLELARALREQIDWDFVRTRSGASPFAQGVLHAGRGPRHRRARDSLGRRVTILPGSSRRGPGTAELAVSPSRGSSRSARRPCSRCSGSRCSSAWS